MHKPNIFREGKRVYLRPAEKADAPLLARWANDPKISLYMNRLFPVSEIEEERLITERAQGASRTRIFLIIVLKGEAQDADRPIGWMSMGDTNDIHGTATTGALIGEKDCWEKGYGTEAKMLLLDFAFNTLNLRKIYSSVLAFNKRSAGYSLKCGYRLEATFKRDTYSRGRYIDRLMFSVYADRWRKLWAKDKHKYLPR